MTPLELREFQAKHTDWHGRSLGVDGVLSAETRWSLAISRLDPRRQEIVRRACASVGVQEDGPNRAIAIDAWVRRCGAPLGSAWCAAFASWCISVPGLPEIRQAGAQALGRMLRSSVLVTPGDVMWFPTGEWQGHCGIVVGIAPGEVATVEGNQRNAVRLVRRHMSEVRFATPLPPEEQAGVPPGLDLIRVQLEGTR